MNDVNVNPLTTSVAMNSTYCRHQNRLLILQSLMERAIEFNNAGVVRYQNGGYKTAWDLFKGALEVILITEKLIAESFTSTCTSTNTTEMDEELLLSPPTKQPRHNEESSTRNTTNLPRSASSALPLVVIDDNECRVPSVPSISVPSSVDRIMNSNSYVKRATVIMNEPLHVPNRTVGYVESDEDVLQDSVLVAATTAASESTVTISTPLTNSTGRTSTTLNGSSTTYEETNTSSMRFVPIIHSLPFYLSHVLATGGIETSSTHTSFVPEINPEVDSTATSSSLKTVRDSVPFSMDGSMEASTVKVVDPASIQTEVDSLVQCQLTSATVIFNLALVEHTIDDEAESSISLYELASTLLLNLVTTTSDEKQAFLNLNVALINNIGTWYYNRDDYDSAQRCMEYILQLINYYKIPAHNEDPSCTSSLSSCSSEPVLVSSNQAVCYLTIMKNVSFILSPPGTASAAA